MTKLNIYRFILKDGSQHDIKAATSRGAERLFISKHGARKLMDLDTLLFVGGEVND